ncbi:MFS transporter [Metallosphaera tengchongensis]|uniref:MFS transporter n=1 Tax=Metallosphaera tengchongensis TaxID=1532350 RepID=A0A6N0NZ42_9CREN|nr:MFS transporter [Metallosphaera tengchongensis]QKR00809.1 MFS transporter [Metallosphaera tengchongensis]
MRKEIFLGWFGTFLQLLIRSSWGVISVPLATVLHLNSLGIGLIASAFYLGYVVTSIPWGVTIDRFGPTKVISLSSLVLLIINLLLFLNLSSFTLVFIAYLMEGTIASGIFPSAMKVVSLTESGSGLVSSIALLDGALPVTILLLGVISPVLIKDWRYLFLALSLGFAIALILSLRVKVNNRPIGVRRSLTILMDRRVAIATAMRFGEMWSTWGTITWIFPLLVLYRHVSTSLSGVFLLLFGLGQLLGILAVGRLVNVMGDKKVILINLLGFLLLTGLVAVTTSTMLLMVEALPLGVFSFAFRPPTDALIIKVSGNLRAGTSIGFTNSVSQVATMVVPSFIGLVLLATHSFPLSMVSLDLGCIVSIICLFLIYGGA